LKYHPDKVPEEEREAASAKFAEIANAYEVLSGNVIARF
jgi:DnaJ-class molecular chaperone